MKTTRQNLLWLRDRTPQSFIYVTRSAYFPVSDSLQDYCWNKRLDIWDVGNYTPRISLYLRQRKSHYLPFSKNVNCPPPSNIILPSFSSAQISEAIKPKRRDRLRDWLTENLSPLLLIVVMPSAAGHVVLTSRAKFSCKWKWQNAHPQPITAEEVAFNLNGALSMQAVSLFSLTFHSYYR